MDKPKDDRARGNGRRSLVLEALESRLLLSAVDVELVVLGAESGGNVHISSGDFACLSFYWHQASPATAPAPAPEPDSLLESVSLPDGQPDARTQRPALAMDISPGLGVRELEVISLSDRLEGESTWGLRATENDALPDDPLCSLGILAQ